MLSEIQSRRLAIFAYLAEQAPKKFGRTALMKFCYFLQEICGTPLEYRFSLYSYGPFDSEVLIDLQAAESYEVVQSTIHYHSGGYGYEIEEASNSDVIQNSHIEFISSSRKSLDWVLSRFGSLSPSDLELISTIVFVHAENSRLGTNIEKSATVGQVKEIKPRFSVEKIDDTWKELNSEGILGHVIH